MNISLEELEEIAKRLDNEHNGNSRLCYMLSGVLGFVFASLIISMLGTLIDFVLGTGTKYGKDFFIGAIIASVIVIILIHVIRYSREFHWRRE